MTTTEGDRVLLFSHFSVSVLFLSLHGRWHYFLFYCMWLENFEWQWVVAVSMWMFCVFQSQQSVSIMKRAAQQGSQDLEINIVSLFPVSRDMWIWSHLPTASQVHGQKLFDFTSQLICCADEHFRFCAQIQDLLHPHLWCSDTVIVSTTHIIYLSKAFFKNQNTVLQTC